MSYRITEYEVGRDFKDHLAQSFLAVPQSKQDDPAPCPVQS